MAINPLHANAQTTLYTGSTAEKKNSTGGSAFDSILSSLSIPDSAPADTKQAAAELLRMEMMQSTLSLFDEEQTCHSSGMQALESLLDSLVRPRHPVSAAGSPFPQKGAGGAPVGGVAGGYPSEAGAQMDQIGNTAAKLLGTPYLFGGEGPNGIDCSSLVQQVFQEHQIELPRTAREQMKVGTDVPLGDLRKGDLVFFQTYASYPSHVGIYLGEGKMIHASSGKGEVTVSDMNSEYYRSRFLGAKRVA